MAVTDIKQKQLPNWSRSGTKQGVQSVVWEVETDEPHAGGDVIFLAQTSSAGDGPIPSRGDALAVDNGIVTAGVNPLNVAAWTVAGPNRYADGGAIALDEQAESIDPGNSKNYRIVIGYRAPQAGQLERSDFLSRFNSGLTFPTPPSETSLSALSAETVVAALAPTTEPRELRTEYVMREVLIDKVRTATINTVSTQEQPFRNPNGELYSPLIELERVPIAVVTQMVGSEEFASKLNAVFKRTMNNDVITHEGIAYPKYHARWLYAEDSSVQREGKDYRVLTYRVELNNRPYFEIRAATGSYFKKQGAGDRRFIDVDDEGNPIVSDYPLTIQGFRAQTVQQQHFDQYTRYKPVNYGNLLAVP